MMHISNRYLDLEPVLAAAARADGWEAAMLDRNRSGRYLNDHASTWVAMTRNRQMMVDLVLVSGAGKSWKKLEPRPGFPGWTDDYSTILPLLQGLGVR